VSADDAEEVDPTREEHLEFGHVMEPVILGWYAGKQGVEVIPGGHVPHREVEWLWASLDAFVLGANRIVEVKHVSSPALYSHWDLSSQDGIPGYVRAQVTVGMACHGAREADVVACVGGRPPHTWRVSYDPELGDMLIDGARRFWQLVKDGTPPPFDATPACKAYLRHKFPANIEKTMCEADEETDSLGVQRRDAAVLAKRAKGEIERLDAEILARVGPFDGITGSGWKMTWKLDKGGVRRQRFTSGKEE
jgi:predicted phage-related endonuclease